MDGARWLHVTGITPALSDSARAAVDRAIELARAAGLTISLDVNLRRRLWSDDVAGPVLRTLAGSADVVFGSPDEFAVLAGADATDSSANAALARAILDLGPAIAVVKLAGDGAFAMAEDGQAIEAPAFAVKTVIDPVGAGDAFCAGFIAARLEGADLAAALDAGRACGASAVTASGDMAGLLDRSELDRLLAAGGPDTLR